MNRLSLIHNHPYPVPEIMPMLYHVEAWSAAFMISNSLHKRQASGLLAHAILSGLWCSLGLQPADSGHHSRSENLQQSLLQSLSMGETCGLRFSVVQSKADARHDDAGNTTCSSRKMKECRLICKAR